jgi:phosphoserine phosphatase
MINWFMRQGYPEAAWTPRPPAAALPPSSAAAAAAPSAAATTTDPAQQQPPSHPPPSRRRDALLLLDFDRTIVDYDAGERLVGELAPELAPQLAALQMPADFVPLTNDVLAEMARRGVTRERLLEELKAMGGEVPAGAARMLRWAAERKAAARQKARQLRQQQQQQQRGGSGGGDAAAVAAAPPTTGSMDVIVLSDCNAIFIAAVLMGAQLAGFVDDVVTNPSSFEQQQAAGGGSVASEAPGSPGGSDSGSAGGAGPPRERLVVRPRHSPTLPPHGCPRCPTNLCKGAELRALRRRTRYGRVVFAGDGANDLCCALALESGDVVLPRRGHALAALLEAEKRKGELRASVVEWETHDELAVLVERAVAAEEQQQEAAP